MHYGREGRDDHNSLVTLKKTQKDIRARKMGSTVSCFQSSTVSVIRSVSIMAPHTPDIPPPHVNPFHIFGIEYFGPILSLASERIY